MPRSAGAIADDLFALTRAAGLKPLYLLVANSLGSQPARLFAFRRPADVKGMVLVDPYVEGLNGALDRIKPPIPGESDREKASQQACVSALLKKELTKSEAVERGCVDAPDPAFSPGLTAIVQDQRMGEPMVLASASELDALEGESARQIRAETRPLGAMPILVLTAGADFAGDPLEQPLLAELRRLHRTLAAVEPGRGASGVEGKPRHSIERSRRRHRGGR